MYDPNQSGFKWGHTTETALLSVLESLRSTTAACQSSALFLLGQLPLTRLTTKSSSPHSQSSVSQDLPSGGSCPTSQGDL